MVPWPKRCLSRASSKTFRKSWTPEKIAESCSKCIPAPAPSAGRPSFCRFRADPRRSSTAVSRLPRCAAAAPLRPGDDPARSPRQALPGAAGRRADGMHYRPRPRSRRAARKEWIGILPLQSPHDQVAEKGGNPGFILRQAQDEAFDKLGMRQSDFNGLTSW